MTEIKVSQKIIITDQHSQISVRDRGLNYGDGFFTTAKIVAGKVQLWSLHKARLIECAQRLAFGNIDFVKLENTITECVSAHSLGILKIVVTRGEGGRGYGLPQQPTLTLLLSIQAFPVHYEHLNEVGMSLTVSPIKLASQPLLAGLKTLNRLEQVLIKQEMQSATGDDVVVLDYDNNVVETSAANIFAIKNNKLLSPVLTDCGIKGVYLQSLCSKLPIRFIAMSLDDLKQMDAIFICNSLMGTVPITRLDNVQFKLAKSRVLLENLIAKESAC